MTRRIGWIAAVLLVACSASAAAQKPGTVELGGFGRYTKFDKATNFDDRPGVGARLGIFVLPNLEVEGDASYTATYTLNDDLVRNIPIHARLVYNLPVGAHGALLVGGGYVRNMFRKNYVESANGFGGLVGVRLGLGELLSIRLDATGDSVTRAARRARSRRRASSRRTTTSTMPGRRGFRSSSAASAMATGTTTA
jgi:Outer membrane protein beta-barrel domain